MTINLNPEDQKLVEKRLQSGVFTTPEEVIHRALESLDADEDWLQESRASVNEKIERGLAQLEQGQGLSTEDVQARLEAKKQAWRSEQRRR